MDKLIILALYVDISNVSYADIRSYMQKVKQSLNYDKFSYKGYKIDIYYIPIRGQSKLECIYPKYIVKKDKFDNESSIYELLEKLKEQNNELNKKQETKGFKKWFLKIMN